MSHWDIRSFWRNRRLSQGRVRHAGRHDAAGIASVAGHASASAGEYRRPSLHAPRPAQMETLEGRVLLSGDHPSFNQVFGVSGLSPTVVDVSSGAGEATGIIGFNNDDDMFQFTTSADDFVTLRVDTLNDTVSSLDSMVRIFSTTGTELFTGNANDLAPGRTTDGWLGAFLTAGTYYVQVRSNVTTGTKATGAYTLRADVSTAEVDVSTGAGSSVGAITDPTDDETFRVEVASEDFVSFLADTLATDFGGTETNLNTKIAVYTQDGQLVQVSSGNGTLTGSVTVTPTDAWAGFLAEAGTYYVRVLSDRSNVSFGTGAYTLFADVETDLITPDNNTGIGAANGTLTRLGEDVIYRVEIPDADAFDSLMTIIGGADPLVLDTHLDIYAADGDFIVSDSTSGNSTNAYAIVPGGPGNTVFVRIRSDEIGNPAFRPSTGAYSLQVDAAATEAPLDPVTRIYSNGGLSASNQIPELFVFETLATGTTIIFASPSGLPPLSDPALTLLDSNGQVIEFNDDTFGVSPQIDTDLPSGQRFFVVVDGFDNGGGGGFRLNIEQTTNTAGGGTNLDDHANRGDWINATPIQWADIGGIQHPGAAGFPGVGLPAGYSRTGAFDDHSLVVYGYTRGRVYSNGDTDVFMVIPQMDMHGQFEGIFARDRTTNEPLFDPLDTWEHGIRPASRLQIMVRGNIDGTLTPTVNVYRSNVIRDANAGPIATNSGVLTAGAPPWQAANWRAGFVDPAAFEPELSIPLGDPVQYAAGGANGLAVWGGEPIFIEIQGTGTGTYEIMVVGDAAPDETDTNRDELISEIREIYGVEPGQAGFTAGLLKEITFGTSPGGDGVPGSGSDGLFHSSDIPSASIERVFYYGEVQPPQIVAPIPGPINQNPNPYGPPSINNEWPPDPVPPLITYGGATVLRETNALSIDRIDDKDVFRFRATGTGTTEIRLNTTNVANTFSEYIASGLDNLTPEDPMEPLPDADYSEYILDEVYDSLLDGTLRIYNADFEQVAFNDDSGVIRGDSAVQQFGELGDFTFQKRDPRVVFDVNEGETYYIVVESAQRYIDGTAQNVDDREYATEDGTAAGTLNNQYIDWRFATGSYELLVNTMAQEPLGNPQPFQLATGDDHIDLVPAAFPNVAEAATVLFVQDDGTIDGNSFTAGNGSRYAGTITNRGTTRDSDLFTFLAPSSGTLTLTAARSGSNNSLLPTFTAADEDGFILASGTASSIGSISGEFEVEQGQRYFIAIEGGGGSQGRFTLDLTGFTTPDDHADIGQFEQASVLPIQDFLGGGEGSGNIEAPGDTDVFVFEGFTTQDVTVTINPTSALDPVVEVYEVQEDLLGHPIMRRIAIAAADTNYTLTFTMNRNRLSGLSTSLRDQYFLSVKGANAANEAGTYRFTFEFEPTDDHPDLAELEDPETRTLASLLLADTATGLGNRNGEIEFEYDSDLFVYVAPAGGPAIISATLLDDSELQPRVAIYDSTGTLIAENDPFVTTPVDIEFDALRGQAYYVVVAPSEFLFNPNGTPIDPEDPRLTGRYRLNVTGPAVDDHANQSEFDRATVVSLDSATGNGAVGSTTPNASDNPEISPLIDTDLFRFSPRGDGLAIIRVASLSGSLVRPAITVFREDTPGVYTQIGFDSRTTPGAVQININDADSDTNYYVQVEDVFNSRSGEYRLTIDGQPGGGGTTDPAAVNFNDPDGDIALSEISGNGSLDASIDVVGDRDLYTFTALGSGPVFVQVVTADGSTLNASVTVLKNPNELPASVVGFDAAGLPGVSASVAFGGPGSATQVTEGQQFWVIVDGIGTSVGGYRIRVNGTPAAFETVGDIEFRHRVYYPEGFANASITEVIAIANPGTVDANFRVVLYYQSGVTREVYRSDVNEGIRTVAAGSRSGVTLSQQGVGARFNVRQGEAYSIVVESDQPITATVSHYDRDVATGEAATRDTAPTWYFPRVERDPGAVQDFITLYNPNDFSLNLTLTAYTSDGQQIVISRSGANALPANRRGGFAINNLEQLPIGTFAVKVEATPRNSAFNSQYIGIVAALTHYNQGEQQGFGMVGDPNMGTASVVNDFTRGNGATSEIAIFNPGNVAAAVTINGDYTSSTLPDFVRTLQVPAGSVRFLSAKQVGITNNQTAGLQFISSVPVSIMSNQVQKGDADATLAQTQAGTTAFFGDAYMTKKGAGVTYFETLSFYNPAAEAIDVTVQLLFTNGASTTVNVNIGAGDFQALQLHQINAFLNNPNRTSAFSIITTSASPFAVNFSHYDLSFGGGWATAGAPFGLFNPISGILA